MIRELIILSGPLINRSLSAAIAVIAASFLLYTLVNGIRNRVARNVSGLLLWVLIVYVGDLGVTYSRGLDAVNWLRFQWIGIAFLPAAYVHLSDSILELTGLPSRGRRRRITRMLYAIAALFLALVWFSEVIVSTPRLDPVPHFQTGPIFPLFFAYFAGSVITSYWFILRARARALTGFTRRRVTQLLFTYAAPALAVFPFLLVSGQSLASPVIFYGILIVVDGVLAVTLSFMGYVLAFFGTLLPERLIKAQMLQFFLRGPVVAIAALAVIVWVPSAGRVLRLPGEEVMPFLAVTVILFLQWAITLIRPYLDRWLIYTGDSKEIRRIQQLETRLLTGADFRQMLESILNGVCDFLRVERAFVVSITPTGTRLEQAIGLREEEQGRLESAQALSEQGAAALPPLDQVESAGDVFTWGDFWLIPLHAPANGGPPRLLGILGIDTPDTEPDDIDEDTWSLVMGLASRTAEVLEDRRVQSEVFATLEGLLPAIPDVSLLRRAQYGDMGRAARPSDGDLSADPGFAAAVKDALADYWGGPRLTDKALLRLAVVRKALDENEGNPQRAVRAVLQEAIENLRPEGQRSMTTAEWIMYNILEMRFIQGRKVREVAMRLAMSEADFYRKQRASIEAIAEIVAQMERESEASPPPLADEQDLPINRQSAI